MDNTNVIRIESVSKQFGQPQNGVLALRDVSLSVRAGEFLSIIGPSGCGKSTLLRLVADLLTPTTGRVAINDHTAQAARLARECSVVFQSPTLMAWRSVMRNIELPLEISGVPRSKRQARAAELLDLIRLREFGARYPHELSVGMQQQVAIARALATQPAVLLMDEPFGALDEITRERLGRELLGIWARAHVTILFVTHSVGEAVRLSDRVAVMSPRPGHVERVIDIDLPRPRPADIRELPRYWELLRQVRAALHLNDDAESEKVA